MTFQEFKKRAFAIGKRYMNLKRDIDNKNLIYDSIVGSIEFKGTNLWILVFATFVASLGLNMNSVAVIIGAMLISPLMGPIQGIGLGVGISSPDLIYRSFKNLAVATVFSMLTSCLYFLISPINEARSELLARTTPTIYDVMIAFFGGMAGIIATGSKEKGNVIPGVAIATALMPPLCTSGYGLATGQWNFFFGAFYLYMINCVYIGFATWLGVRIFKMPKQVVADEKKRKRIMQTVSTLVLVTALPSFYITYRIVEENIQEANVIRFVNNEFSFPQSMVMSKQILDMPDNKKMLEISLIGHTVPKDSLNIISSKMPLYGLKDMTLRVVQNYAPTVNEQIVNTQLVQDMLKSTRAEIDTQNVVINQLKAKLSTVNTTDSLGIKLTPELNIFFPQIKEIGLSRTYVNSVGKKQLDPVLMILAYVDKQLTPKEQEHLIEWLGGKTGSKNVKLYVEEIKK